MSDSKHLTLGALYREMRAGLGDAGWVRITLEFRQLTVEEGGTLEAGAGEAGGLLLQALVDHHDGTLDRAEVSLTGPAPLRRLTVRRHADGYAYSIDGGQRWGPFTSRPRIFDLPEFEAELDQVVVDDVTFEPVAAVDALDVSLNREAFARLLRIFSADLEEEPEDLALSAFSVSLEAADDVSLVYWWSLNGLDAPGPVPDDLRSLRISCSVSIRVARASEPAVEEVTMDEALPPAGHIDEVWALLRRRPSE